MRRVASNELYQSDSRFNMHETNVWLAGETPHVYSKASSNEKNWPLAFFFFTFDHATPESSGQLFGGTRVNRTQSQASLCTIKWWWWRAGQADSVCNLLLLSFGRSFHPAADRTSTDLTFKFITSRWNQPLCIVRCKIVPMKDLQSSDKNRCQVKELY